MKAYEREFEVRLDAVRQDSRACTVFVYTELTFHYLAGSDPEILERVRMFSEFWNGVLGGLQTAAFISLGRLYDSDNSAHTIASLLDYAEQYRGMFSRGALQARKEPVMGLAGAKAYVADSYDLPSGGLKAWREEYSACRELYVQKVQPIRHQVFAHAGKLTQHERDALFTRLFTRELERLSVFPLQLAEALWQLYVNGREPRSDAIPSIISEVIANAPDSHTSTWEHLHVAQHTARFLEWMKTGPGPDVSPEIVSRIEVLLDETDSSPAGQNGN